MGCPRPPVAFPWTGCKAWQAEANGCFQHYNYLPSVSHNSFAVLAGWEPHSASHLDLSGHHTAVMCRGHFFCWLLSSQCHFLHTSTYFQLFISCYPYLEGFHVTLNSHILQVKYNSNPKTVLPLRHSVGTMCICTYNVELANSLWLPLGSNEDWINYF